MFVACVDVCLCPDLCHLVKMMVVDVHEHTQQSSEDLLNGRLELFRERDIWIGREYALFSFCFWFFLVFLKFGF